MAPLYIKKKLPKITTDNHKAFQNANALTMSIQMSSSRPPVCSVVATIEDQQNVYIKKYGNLFSWNMENL